MGGPRLLRGIPPEMVSDAAELLAESFALKVQHELRPRTPQQAVRLVAGSINEDLGWVALDMGGALVGIAGVGMHGRRFSHVGFRSLAREFGWLGAIPRWVLAAGEAVLTRPRKQQWRVEVIAVRDTARGRGVGTALLGAVIEAAREAGMRTVELEVVDVNERAMRLYEQIGFRRIFTLPTGLLTARGGYRGVRFMRLDL
ncbi:MAG: GNAT family N-acetyltransferase [Coriobacteriia bacterium]|nr:GNAT family N-acetyltransferase [Coriobacteriia bacterium]